MAFLPYPPGKGPEKEPLVIRREKGEGSGQTDKTQSPLLKGKFYIPSRAQELETATQLEDEEGLFVPQSKENLRNYKVLEVPSRQMPTWKLS